MFLFSLLLLLISPTALLADCDFPKAPDFAKVGSFWKDCDSVPISISKNIHEVINGRDVVRTKAEFYVALHRPACFSTSDHDIDGVHFDSVGYKIEVLSVDHVFPLDRVSKRVANMDVAMKYFFLTSTVRPTRLTFFKAIAENISNFRLFSGQVNHNNVPHGPITYYGTFEMANGSDFVHLAETLNLFEERVTLKVVFLLPNGTESEPVVQTYIAGHLVHDPIDTGPANVSIANIKPVLQANPLLGSTQVIYKDHLHEGYGPNSVDSMDVTRPFGIGYNWDVNEATSHVRDYIQGIHPSTVGPEISVAKSWSGGLKVEGQDAKHVIGRNYNLGIGSRISIDSSVDIGKIYRSTGIASGLECKFITPLIHCTITNVTYSGEELFTLRPQGQCESVSSVSVRVFAGSQFQLAVRKSGEYDVCSTFGVCFAVKNVILPRWGDAEPDAPPSPPVPQEDKSHRTLIIVAISIVTLILFGITGFVAYKRHK